MSCESHNRHDIALGRLARLKVSLRSRFDRDGLSALYVFSV